MRTPTVLTDRKGDAVMNVGLAIGIVLFILVAVVLFPTITTSATDAENTTRTGSAESAILGLFGLLFAIIIILVTVATTITKYAKGVKAYNYARDTLAGLWYRSERTFSMFKDAFNAGRNVTIIGNRRGISAMGMLGTLFGVFILVIIGLAMYPTVEEAVWNEVRSNSADPNSGLKSGAEYTILNLTTLFYLIGLLFASVLSVVFVLSKPSNAKAK